MLDREGCILCNLLPGIGYVKYSALVAEFGAPSRIFGRTPEEYRRVTGIGQQLAERLSRAADRYREDRTQEDCRGQA